MPVDVTADVVAYCDVPRRREMHCQVQVLAFLQVGALGAARDAHKTHEERAVEHVRLARLDEWAKRKAQREEAARPTIQKYAEYLRLHAKDESRTKAETVYYNALGKRHRWHGRPQHVVHRRDRRPAPTLCLLRRDRAPRSRRVRTARTSRGSPAGRSTDDSELEGACPRCGAGVVVFRGVETCAACWATTVLLLEERSA